MSAGIELALHIAMMQHGIEYNMTVALKDQLGIEGVDDLADMEWSAVLRTPEEYHERIVDLRNEYVRDDQPEWTTPASSIGVIG